MKYYNKLKYFITSFSYLRVLFSPFKPFSLNTYFGKVSIGTPYFYPRRWIKDKDKKGYLKSVPKYIGFDFVPLGWKSKFDDYRFEWSPLISFVFFKWQFVLFIETPHSSHYWESWLYYDRDSDKTKSRKERIAQCRKEAPQIWTVSKNGDEETIDYYTLIIKDKYL